MLWVTTPCVQGVARALQGEYECLVFHATGAGGQSLEKLADDGHLAALVDLTTTEIADLLCGGVLSAGEDRLGAPTRRPLPYIGSCGALDMVNFWGRETVPRQFDDRLFHVHNANVTLMRTTPDENDRLGKEIAHKASAAKGPTAVYVPLRGVSALDREGQPFWWPEADRALFDSLRLWMSPHVRLIEVDLHINDPEFARRMAEGLLEMLPKR